MNQSNGILKVTIVEARKLKDKYKDTTTKDDAYVELYLDKDYKQRTTTIKDSNYPIWNESFILYVFFNTFIFVFLFFI